MNRALEVVSRIEELGGYLALDVDGSIRYRVPKDNPEAQVLLEAVRAEKQNLLAYLRQRPAPDSAYSKLTCRAMRQIEQVCPPGALQWAREVHPVLTDKIDVELFARLDDLWNDHAPLPDFEATLEELVSAHAEVGRLFREQAL